MQQRQVRDLMRIRHGHVMCESAKLREAAERLIISDCDVIAVTDSNGKLAGVVCESSVVRALMGNPAECATIQSIISRHADSIRLDAALNSVLPLFRSSANTAIPVVDERGSVCGLLMRRDVIACLLHLRHDAQAPAASMNSEAAPSPAPGRVPFRKPTTMLMAHPGDRDHSELAPSQKPHFLRANEAHRVLWEAEDRL